MVVWVPSQNPLVILNPYAISPLSALILFNTEERVTTTISVQGKELAGNVEKVFSANTTHILPVLGLYADYKILLPLLLAINSKKYLQLLLLPCQVIWILCVPLRPVLPICKTI